MASQSASSAAVSVTPTQSNKLLLHQPIVVSKHNAKFGCGGFSQTKIGDVYNYDYVIKRQLGIGGFGTVWLAENTNTKGYVAIKIAKCSERHTDYARKEIENLRRLDTPDDGKVGYSLVARMSDFFTVFHPYGFHSAIAIEALGPNLNAIMKRSSQRIFHLQQVKNISRQLVQAVSYLHDECKLIHGDIKPANMMVQVDKSDIETLGSSNNSMTSYNVDFTSPTVPVRIKLGDFGLAHSLDEPMNRTIQTCTFRAPEVFLRSETTASVDLWSIGCVVYELITNQTLFDCKGLIDEDVERFNHLRMMQTLLGPLKRNFYVTSSNTDLISAYFYADGGCKVQAVYEHSQLRARIANHRTMSPDDFDDAIRLIRSLLRLHPHLRESAENALKHNFLASHGNASMNVQHVQNLPTTEQGAVSSTIRHADFSHQM